ncbi:hypothetical protein BRC81_02185 [Halobacteriales archaeon QS_1_68_20]|nr:MAG: hypothetical protein BRC81_02185 [Halobacteriales archaeon QS_1_68_20]
MTDDSFLGLDATTQAAAIAVLGVVLVIAGESMSSAADPEYDPTVYGIGLVMVVYGVGRLVWEWLGD